MKKIAKMKRAVLTDLTYYVKTLSRNPILCSFAAIVLLMIINAVINTVKLDGKFYSRFSSDVFMENCSNEDARILETMPFIYRLEIKNCMSDNISFIEHKKFLKELGILQYYGDWSPLRSCNGLRSFSTTNSTFDDLTYFSGMTELERLDLAVFSYGVQINSKNGIEALRSLKNLRLCGLKEKDLSSINDLSELENLYLIKCDIENINIDLEKIEYINLSHNYKLKSCNIKSSCIELQRLVIADCPEINMDIDELTALPTLKEITVSNCPEIDMDIDKLTAFPALEEITVSRGVFTGEEIEKLRHNGINVTVR